MYKICEKKAESMLKKASKQGLPEWEPPGKILRKSQWGTLYYYTINEVVK